MHLLSERKANDKYVIFNADDFGMSYANNQAIQSLFLNHHISSSTLMVPCPWAKQAAQWAVEHPQYDIGVHLTLTNEWDKYKWGPLHSNLTSLTTPDGYFPTTTEQLENMAKEEEVKLELVAQVERALEWGLDITHLDNHMGSVYGLHTGKHFIASIFEICLKFQLPFRFPRHFEHLFVRSLPPKVEEEIKQITTMADQLGIVILDYLYGVQYQHKQEDTYETVRNEFIQLIKNVKPGITEFIFHPAIITEEWKEVNPHYNKRDYERLVLEDEQFKQVLRDENIKLISWRQLRDTMRADKS
ncbi:polysaccharide deacetylase family protein [Longirhabdus pacifica]|uniref:polysaccharide deacetylase family protein n=1 Tax=Longirhabdus pacifica TaxID=2305227 RepID=UPI0013E8BAD1|nr:polysaccharide deacetylase family protein [Longirhabdus pacifica]